jgi:hypothetical protein
MGLIFIHGLPAGKLTVAHELAAMTGYKIFHNHLVSLAGKASFSLGDPVWP